MKLAVGCDHAGFNLKETVVKYLRIMGHEVTDCGTNSTVSCDYPDYAAKVCKEIVEGRAERGILICGTGIGMSIAANKVHGIRAACCSDTYSARFTRMHNDANVLCFGARVVGEGLALDLVDLFLETPFENSGNHPRRVAKIAKMEE